MRFTFICFCIFWGFNSSAQKIIIETKLSRTLYCGIDNPVSIWIEGYSPKELNYNVDIGEIISKSETGSLVWRICTSNVFSAKLKVSVNQKVIQEITFRVKRLPTPDILLPGNSHASPFSKIIWQGIRADIKDFAFEGIFCKIVSYDVTIAIKDSKDTIRLINKGAFINKENIPYFEKLKPGDIVFISNVSVKVGCATDIYIIDQVFKRAIY
jgi:hypothetical protein